MDVAENLAGYKKGEYDYNTYLTNLLTIIENDEDKKKYDPALLDAIRLGPEKDEEKIKAKISMLIMLHYGLIPKVADIKGDYGVNYGVKYYYNLDEKLQNTPFNKLSEHPYYTGLEKNYKQNTAFKGGNRRNKPKSKAKPKPTPKAKPDDMNMKDVKDLCKANQIKLSKVVNEKRVRFTKKELLTKLKRKKLI
jgi:hypothetical protein